MGGFSSRRGEEPSDLQRQSESKDLPLWQRLARGLSRFVYEMYQGVSFNSRWILKSKDLPSLRRVGRGLSGFVYETTWKGQRYARKDFPLGSDKHNSVFQNEAKYLFNLDHPNVVKCIGYTVGKSSCSLVQEYVDDNLENTIQKIIEVQKKESSKLKETQSIEAFSNEASSSKMPRSNTLNYPFEMPQKVDIISQIAAGMKYLHEHEVVHGDLKPRNVLVCSAPGHDMKPNQMVMKVADFGLVETKKRIKLDVSKWTKQFEILMWKAPEVVSEVFSCKDSDAMPTDSDAHLDQASEEIVSSDDILRWSLAKAADVYSFGLLCAHILVGKPIFLIKGEPGESIP